MHARNGLAWVAIGLLLAGCDGVTPAPEAPAPANKRTILHVTEPVDFNALDRRAYCKGEARDAAGDWWSFSTSIGQDAAAAITGSILMANSLTNKTLFGNITAGSLTLGATGGGTAAVTGTLTTGATITLQFTDTNSATAWDTFVFQTGALSFSGEVRHGAIRILRALPLSHGTTNHAGFSFDPRIGLFIYQVDLDAERAPTPEALPVEVLEVTRPNPVINFQADQPGGYTLEPGGDNNVPPP